MKCEKDWASIEEQVGGFPTRKRYSALSGNDFGTYIPERDWEIIATLESAYERLLADPRSEALQESGYNSGESILLSEKAEFDFAVLDS